MLLNLYIGGIDYIDKILKVPFIDESTPEFGNLEGLLNDIIEIKLQIKYLQHFNLQQDMEVLYLRNHTTIFKGKVDKISYDEKYITVQCKSNTSILFNKHIRENEIMSPYVADDMYPADIIKEMLELVGLKMNYTSYLNALQYHQQLEVTLSCTNENWVTSEILNKIAEVTCARIYLYNDEFHYEPFGMYETPPYLDIKSRYWVDYPYIEQFEKYDEEYGGTEVKIGESVSYTLSNERLPEKTIDLSISPTNGVYTDSATTAMHIVDLYDKYLSQNKYKLTGSLKLSTIGQYINKGSFIRWNGRIYAIVNIQNQSYIKKDIEAVGIDYYNIDVKNFFIQGGVLTVALNHNALSGLQGGTTGQYYHLTQTLYNNITTNLSNLTDGSNADSLHTHNLTNITGDLDDIDDGSTYKRITETNLTDLTDGNATTLHKHSLDNIDDGSTYGKIKNTQSNEIDNTSGDLSFTSDAKRAIEQTDNNDILNISDDNMSLYMYNSDIEVSTPANTTYGSLYYIVGDTSSYFETDFIRSRENESFEIVLDVQADTPADDNLNFELYLYDKDKTLLDTEYYTLNTTRGLTSSFKRFIINKDNGGYVGSFSTHIEPNCRYVKLRIIALSGSPLSGTDRIRFTPPILRRMSKHGTEYTFRVKWTGDLEADSTNATILENTDNKLKPVTDDANSGVTATATTTLRLTFESGFLHNDDIVTVCLGYLTSGGKTKGQIHKSVSNIEIVFSLYNSMSSSNDRIYFSVYDNSGSSITMCDNIGTDKNFCDVIIKKRG